MTVNIWVEMEGENPEVKNSLVRQKKLGNKPVRTIRVETGYNPDFNPWLMNSGLIRGKKKKKSTSIFSKGAIFFRSRQWRERLGSFIPRSAPTWAPASGYAWNLNRLNRAFWSSRPRSVRQRRDPRRESAAGRGRWTRWQSTCYWSGGGSQWWRSGRRYCSHRNLPRRCSPVEETRLITGNQFL